MRAPIPDNIAPVYSSEIAIGLCTVIAGTNHSPGNILQDHDANQDLTSVGRARSSSFNQLMEASTPISDRDATTKSSNLKSARLKRSLSGESTCASSERDIQVPSSRLLPSLIHGKGAASSLSADGDSAAHAEHTDNSDENNNLSKGRSQQPRKKVRRSRPVTKEDLDKFHKSQSRLSPLSEQCSKATAGTTRGVKPPVSSSDDSSSSNQKLEALTSNNDHYATKRSSDSTSVGTSRSFARDSARASQGNYSIPPPPPLPSLVYGQGASSSIGLSVKGDSTPAVEMRDKSGRDNDLSNFQSHRLGCYDPLFDAKTANQPDAANRIVDESLHGVDRAFRESSSRDNPKGSSIFKRFSFNRKLETLKRAPSDPGPSRSQNTSDDDALRVEKQASRARDKWSSLISTTHARSHSLPCESHDDDHVKSISAFTKRVVPSVGPPPSAELGSSIRKARSSSEVTVALDTKSNSKSDGNTYRGRNGSVSGDSTWRSHDYQAQRKRRQDQSIAPWARQSCAEEDSTAPIEETESPDSNDNVDNARSSPTSYTESTSKTKSPGRFRRFLDAFKRKDKSVASDARARSPIGLQSVDGASQRLSSRENPEGSSLLESSSFNRGSRPASDPSQTRSQNTSDNGASSDNTSLRTSSKQSKEPIATRDAMSQTDDEWISQNGIGDDNNEKLTKSKKGPFKSFFRSNFSKIRSLLQRKKKGLGDKKEADDNKGLSDKRVVKDIRRVFDLEGVQTTESIA